MFTLNPQYAYLVLCAGFVLVWILIYTFSPMTRHEQFRMSLVSIPGGPLSELLYFRDYWYPESAFSLRLGPIHTLVEDCLFAFTFAGITATLYQIVRGRYLIAGSHLKGGVRQSCLLVAIVSLPLIFLGEVNSIFATSVGFLFGTAWMVWCRPDLWRPALTSGFLVMLMMLTVYLGGYYAVANSEDILRNIWKLYETPWGTRRVMGIPATELIWAFSFGTLFGPLYAFGLRKRYV